MALCWGPDGPVCALSVAKHAFAVTQYTGRLIGRSACQSKDVLHGEDDYSLTAISKNFNFLFLMFIFPDPLRSV